ncbi:NAD(P)-dependent oxidoreductase [Skermania sp. ID1734]|uniref:NAD-dependent epimerase/dehydratase family protein n=1 Tax=Skermania sp. ID1734 TaxID=2597516 RepID=UPI00117E9202|nr:NAD(P)-dependent oxidoreductase [Skermania sp. ID1734]TSE00713.1 NAD(P)-dependent oxidoreductase [Skermania sp. ID1734]
MTAATVKNTAPAWVIGSGGLLGGAVTTELRRRGSNVTTSSIDWTNEHRAAEQLATHARSVVNAGDRWRVFWCAGAGVNGTSTQQFAQEQRVLQSLLDVLTEAPNAANGSFFFASSAGGVYAGTPDAPHTEASTPMPLGDYGRAKIDSEAAVRRFSERTGCATVLGRIANLYGPGQNLTKPQGLVSHLCRGYLLARPVPIYVPMDTLRDLLFVTDAAEMVVDAVDVALDRPGDCVTKIFATGHSVSIGAILGACRMVFRQPPRVIMAASPLAALQGRDLRLRSQVWTELDRRPFRTLPAGIAATLQSIRSAVLR